MTRRERRLWLSPAQPSEQTGSLWELLSLGDPAQSGWMRHGLCAQTDPGAFYPGKGEPTAQAKSVCAVCPVRTECLEYALTHRERFGVWGGLSEPERRRLLRQRQASHPERRVA